MTNNSYGELEKRVAALEAQVMGNKTSMASADADSEGPNWSLNERAFATRYAHGKSGEKKFTLLIAYLAKGSTDATVQIADIKKLWDKMTASSLLGSKFNDKYPTVAKTKGWINSPEKGAYQLAYGWEEVLTQGKAG